MARDVPTTYNPPDPVRSFAVGADILDDSTGADPHAGGDIARAVRYLYAQADAVHIVAQPWCSDQWFGRVGAAFAVAPDAQWFVAPDEAFADLEITIYYEANAANAAGFGVTIKENGATVSLPAVNAAGADRRQRLVWSTSGIEAVAGGQATIELRTAGDGAAANRVKGFYVRRVPLAAGANIPAGKLYGGGFITPDSSAWAADAPLTPDKVSDLATALETLLAYRRAPYLTFAMVGTMAEEYIAGLAYVLPTSFARTHTYHGLSSAVQDVTVYGEPWRNPINTRVLAHAVGITVKTAVDLSLNPAFEVAGNGFVQGFGQYLIQFASPATMISCTIEGP